MASVWKDGSRKNTELQLIFHNFSYLQFLNYTGVSNLLLTIERNEHLRMLVN